MPHSTLLKFTFQYDEQGMIPLIPVNFFYKDGTPTQPFQDAVLDSGANQITIPKALADILGLKLYPLGLKLYPRCRERCKTEKQGTPFLIKVPTEGYITL